LLLAAAALYGFVRAGRAAAWIPLFACLFLGSATLTDVARLVILPGIAAHASLRDFMAEVRRVVGPQDDLSFYKTFDYGAVFYWHGHIPDYAGGRNAAGPRYLLMDKGEWERSHATAGQRYEAVRLSGPPAYTEHGELVLLRRLDSTPALDP
jgi:hypothetical protein